MSTPSDFPAKTTPPRRTYSKEFKDMVLAEARDPNNSIASVARKHDLNANLVHKWCRDRGYPTKRKAKKEFICIDQPQVSSPTNQGHPGSDRIILRANGLEVEWPLIGASQLPAFIAALTP